MEIARAGVLFALVCFGVLTAGCDNGNHDAPDGSVEVRCGEPDVYFSITSAADIAALAHCTVLVGRLQEDSVTTLDSFVGLERVRRIEGTLNVFRSAGFTSLRGLDNLESVDGNLFIHLNQNLQSIAALGKLRSVSGNLAINNNGRLPQQEVDALVARVSVGGTTDATGNGNGN